jgi:adenylosuccinate synthase
MASGYSYRVGGVMKGGGEALMAKMRREVDQKSMPIARERFKGTPFEGSVVPVEEYNDILDKSDIIQIEGAQGFSLGLNQGFYPYGTWRDCSIAQVLSDCAIPMSLAKNIETIGVCRTYPIRVANRYANDGKQIGWSGPCYYDQHELTWEQIGVPPEFTTVSGLKRRVFSFSREQIRQAIRMNDVARVFLNFRNYPMSDEYLARIVESITETGASIWWEGFGPREDQIMEAEDADA